MNCETSDHLKTNIFNNYCSYLNKKVLLETCKSSHTGYVRCIDPLTESVVIVSKQSSGCECVIAMSHAIKSITMIDDNDPNDDNHVIDIKQFLSLMGEQTHSLSEKELCDRKARVVKWLESNRVPVEQLSDGSLVVAYALVLNEPYTTDDCVCSNEIVLSKIQTLLQSMP